MSDAPLWSVNDVVYLRESAVIGFLEGYKVSGIRWDNNFSRWLYIIAIKNRGTEPNTVIDMNNLRDREIIELGENDLVDQVGALDLAITNAQERLTFLQNKRALLP